MVNNWNELSEEVVFAGSVNVFKRKLDIFRKWKKDFLMDYVRLVQGRFGACLVRPNQVINQVINMTPLTSSMTSSVSHDISKIFHDPDLGN